MKKYLWSFWMLDDFIPDAVTVKEELADTLVANEEVEEEDQAASTIQFGGAVACWQVQ